MTRLLAELSLFYPDWLTPWLGVGAVAALILGWARLAFSLAVLATSDVFLFPLLEAYFGELPLWASILVLLLVGLMLVHSVIALLFGHEAAGSFTGIWLVRISDALILGPFRVLRVLFRLFGD